MSKVAIVTDSTPYIPPEELEGYVTGIAPAVVVWEGRELKDGVDIQPNDFYARLKKAKEMPTTSQPSPGAVKEAYEAMIEKGYTDILGIYVSSKLSGTIASATQAREFFPDTNIELVDSLSASMGSGWAILKAAEAAANGASLAECKAIAEKGCEHTGLLLTVETLEFLHRGGRIGGAQRFIGTALSFKPLMEVLDGRIEPIERVRTRKKALKRIVDLAVERIDGRSNLHLAVIHANAQDVAEQVLAMANEVMDIKKSLIAPVSPAVGTHTGPGTIGIAYMAGYED